MDTGREKPSGQLSLLAHTTLPFFPDMAGTDCPASGEGTKGPQQRTKCGVESCHVTSQRESWGTRSDRRAVAPVMTVMTANPSPTPAMRQAVLYKGDVFKGSSPSLLATTL